MDAPPRPARDEYLSPREAASVFTVSARTLAVRLRLGELAGHKERGLRGAEWRVAASTLKAAGYTRREQHDPTQPLQRELQHKRAELQRQRARMDELDARLGQALLDAAHLRAALKRASIPAPREVIDLQEPSRTTQ